MAFAIYTVHSSSELLAAWRDIWELGSSSAAPLASNLACMSASLLCGSLTCPAIQWTSVDMLLSSSVESSWWILSIRLWCDICTFPDVIFFIAAIQSRKITRLLTWSVPEVNSTANWVTRECLQLSVVAGVMSCHCFFNKDWLRKEFVGVTHGICTTGTRLRTD